MMRLAERSRRRNDWPRKKTNLPGAPEKMRTAKTAECRYLLGGTMVQGAPDDWKLPRIDVFFIEKRP
jgi:hypothetical protein